MKFYTADPHFDHANIINLCKRPFKNVIEMQDTLVDNWNERVSDNDDVYMLGDFCFGVKTFIEYIGRLNGTKHFIRGNHDADAIKKVIQMKRSKGSIFDNVFFHGDIHEIKDSGRNIVLCHYPLREWNGAYKGAIHLHGHCHQNIGRSFRDGAYDVGVDGWDFKPVTIKDILNSEIS